MSMSFNPKDYETVESRIKRFYDAYPDGRIVTQNDTALEDRQVATWIVKASIFLSAGDQAEDLPKATGYAFEVDGQGMANKTAALENAETSAIGRALANMGLSGNKRASREEMEKVNRNQPKENWLEQASKLKSVDELRRLYIQAKNGGATESDLTEIARLADEQGTTSKPKRTSGSVSGSTSKGSN